MQTYNSVLDVVKNYTLNTMKYGNFKNSSITFFKNEYGIGDFSFNNDDLSVNKISVTDIEKNVAYIWVESSLAEEYFRFNDMSELERDDIRKVRLEVFSDILEKLSGIMNNEEYDDRVVVQVDLTDEELKFVEKACEEKNMSIDEFFESILQDMIDYVDETNSGESNNDGNSQ